MNDFSKNKPVPIAIAFGDGIGLEIMNSVLLILKEAGAQIRIETIDVGEKLYKKGYTSGISEEAWETLNRTRILLKAPITTPLGGGYKSLNVTMRKAMSLFANVRPAISYSPVLKSQFDDLDVVVIRENVEDLYAGIEYRQTHNVYQSLKLISKTGSQRIIKYAFEYAIANNRKKITCFAKDNIMKFSDGVFHKTFAEIATEYPNIETDYMIIDIGTAKLATKPGFFDVVVTQNLYGDIISDITAEISGSVGLAGSSNIGEDYAMFEAVHGSAPTIAGQNIANPSGLLNAAIMMLVHINQAETANLIENAWKVTLEDGMHTTDIFNIDTSKTKLGTKEFALEIIKRLGQKPKKLKVANYINKTLKGDISYERPIEFKEQKKLVGVDIFLDKNEQHAHVIADQILKLPIPPNVKLDNISSMGLKLWPRDNHFPVVSDYWCLRFIDKSENKFSHNDICTILKILYDAKIDFIKIENLYEFDGNLGFSLLQGQ